MMNNIYKSLGLDNPKGLAIRKWNDKLDMINKQDPRITSLLFQGKTWEARIWIDPEKDNIVHYQYTRTSGRTKGQVFAKGYFPV